jgi:hypothetical protein
MSVEINRNPIVSGQGEQFSSTSLDDPNLYLSAANLNEQNY